MSKLSDLIQELCPNGVETFPLDQVLKSLPKGTLKTNELVENGRYPVINGGRDFYGYYDKFNNSGEVITFSSRGFAGYVQYMNDDFWAGGLCYPYTSADESALLTKFAYYYLKNKESYIMQNIVEHGSIPALNKKDLHKVQIFVPPLPVQREIVRILDTFTELTKELTKELTLRKKQYEYYRDRLLTFDEAHPLRSMLNELCPNGVEYKALKECCSILDSQRQPIKKSQRVKGRYPYYGANGIQDYVDDYIFDGIFVLVGEDGSVMTSSGTPVVHWAEGKIWVNNHAHVIEESEGVMLRYLYYCISMIDIRELVHGNIPKLNQKDFRQLKIPIPPLAVQREIVRILDKFEALCHDLTAGLPAEIAARQKQYEYYRDKLLMFEEKQSRKINPRV